MKKILYLTIILFSLVTQTWAVTPKVIPSTDITYLGAFRAPAFTLSGTANAAVSTTDVTLTDTRLSMVTNAYVGTVITCNVKTMTVTSNTATTLTGASWSGGGNPGNAHAWSTPGFSWLQTDGGGDSDAGLGYYPTDNSLLVMPGNIAAGGRWVGKISIPADVNLVLSGCTYSNITSCGLSTANILHTPVDFAGSMAGTQTILGDIHYLPAKGSQARGHFYWSIYSGYQATQIYGRTNGQFAWSETDLDNLSTAGMWRIGPDVDTASNGEWCLDETGAWLKCTTVGGKYIFEAPDGAFDGTPAEGRTLIVGLKRSGGGRSGPTLYAIAPWGPYKTAGGADITGNDTAPCAADSSHCPPDARDNAAFTGSEKTKPTHWFPGTQVLEYGVTPVNGNAGIHPVDDAAFNTSVTNGAWLSVGTKQAIIFDGDQCYRTIASNTFTYPNTYYPAANTFSDAGGYHAEPCSPTFWFYNVDDIKEVAAGTKLPYVPQPYSRMDLTPYMIMENPIIYGMAYDETNNKLYVLERVRNTSFSIIPPVIHVFQLADVGSTFDTTPPPAPNITIGTITHTSATFTWSNVTDTSGKPVTYFIYRNGYPIANQKALSSPVSYTDIYLDYVLSPVEYYVKAVDSENNSSNSNVLSVTGNAPIKVIMPLNGGNSHETSALKFATGETYSFTPTVKGGVAPYCWTIAGLPTGISINGGTIAGGVCTIAGTGEIYGTPSYEGGNSKARVTVIDAVGNMSSVKVGTWMNSLSASTANYICDRDQDGMCSDFAGCSAYYNTDSCPLHGGDTNDFDANETPNQAYLQPPPTGLTKGTVTSSSVALSWTAPTERLDTYQGTGGPIRKLSNGLDIGYQVYHGTNGTTYPDVVYVGRATSHTWTGLSSGIHYFTVSAVEIRGLESTPSSSVNQTFGEADVTPPTLVSATIPSAGTSISLLFDEAVNRTAGGTLTISMTGGAVTMTYSSGTGTSTLIYILSRTIYQGETGTVSWTTAANKIEDLSGNDWASVSNFSVTNSSTQTPRTGLNGSAFGAYWVEGWAGSYSNGGSIVQTSDGGIVIAGTTWSYAWPAGPSSPSDLPWGTPCIMLVKASIDGVESWRKISCSTGYDVTTKQITSIGWYANKIIASGTNLIVAGTRDAIDGYTHGFLIKYDSSGTLVWDRSFVGTGSRSDDITDVVEITGGGFAICGTSYDGTHNGIWLILTDANGQNATQHYYYYLSKGYAHGLKIRKTADGGYIMAGYTQTGSSPDEDIYAVKVTSDGTPVWNNLYDNAGRRDYANGVEEDGDGNYWIFARSRLPGQENTRIWIVKVAYDDGTLLASYEIGDALTSHAYVPKQSVKLASGNLLILGYTNVSGGTGYHGYVTEINTSGVVQGTPQAIGVMTGYTEDYIYDGVVSADGNYYLLVGNDNGGFSTAYDFWYLKMAVSDRSIQNLTTCETKTTYYYDKNLNGLGNNNQWTDPTADCCSSMAGYGYVLDHTDPNDGVPYRSLLGTGSAMRIGSGDIFDLGP